MSAVPATATRNVLMEYADFYAAKGWLIAPVEITVQSVKGKMKKFPLNRIPWGDNSTRDRAVYGDWFSEEANKKYPKQGIQIQTGPESDLLVLDSDNVGLMVELEIEYGALPETYTVRSQSGSDHYYFKWPTGRITVQRKNWGTGVLMERQFDSATGKEGGIDLRGEGGVIYAPPTSVYDPKGAVVGSYTLVKDVAVAEAPQWLIDLYESKLREKAVSERPRPKDEEWLEANDTWDVDAAESARDTALEWARDRFQELIDDPGAYWDNGTTSVMGMLVRLVNSPWAEFDEHDLDAFLRNYAPEDDGFGQHDHERIKNSCFRMADGEVLDMPDVASTKDMQIAHLLWGIKQQEEAKEAATDKEGPLAVLPDEFWNARPVLKNIRQNAWAATDAPDAVLHAFLAAYMARVPWQYQVNTGMLVPAQPIFFAAICAPSGMGKGSATALGFELARNEERALPLGTGEGLAEHFLESQVDLANPANWKKNKSTGDMELIANPTTKKVQTKHSILLNETEGSNLATMLDRHASTLAGQLLRLGVGEELGQTNAYETSSRYVPGRSYSAGMVIGFQYEPAGNLLARHGVGLSQRFLWSAVFDPNAPEYIDPAPAPTFWEPLPVAGDDKVDIWVDPTITDPMRQARIAKLRGELVEDTQDAHRTGLLLRISLALRLLDGPNVGMTQNPDGSWNAGTAYQITVEDWRLANIMYDTSRKLRQQLVARVREAENEAQKVQGKKDAVRRVAAQETETDIRLSQVREKLLVNIEKLKANGASTTVSHLRNSITKNSRPLVEDALVQLVGEGILTVDDKGIYDLAPTPAA